MKVTLVLTIIFGLSSIVFFSKIVFKNGIIANNMLPYKKVNISEILNFKIGSIAGKAYIEFETTSRKLTFMFLGYKVIAVKKFFENKLLEGNG